MFLTIAWRNIWRNTRRTMVILIAIIIGVWSMIFLGAFMRGIEDGMMKNGIKTLTGHIQIHKVGYRNDPVVDNSMIDVKVLQSQIEKYLPPGGKWTLRIRVNGVASNARHSGAVTLVGIEPEKEAGMSFIGGAVNNGRYLKKEDEHGILVGRAFAEDFETGLGHKLILMSRDTRGEIASRAFKISGIFDAEMEVTEKRFVFISVNAARKMLKLEHGMSEVSILLEKEDQVADMLNDLQGSLPESTYEVLSWMKLQPLLQTYLKLFDEFIAILGTWWCSSPWASVLLIPR